MKCNKNCVTTREKFSLAKQKYLYKRLLLINHVYVEFYDPIGALSLHIKRVLFDYFGKTSIVCLNCVVNGII